MSFPSPVPRRVGRPSWLDLRLVLGVALVAVAVLLGATVVGGARRTEKQLALTHDLAAGATLRPGDLRVVDVRLPDSSRVYVRDEAKAVGKMLDRPLARGELLPADVLRRAPARTTVTVPFASGTAPRLARGQRIVVWLSTASCPSSVLLSDVTVQDVHVADAGSFATAGSGQDVVVSVTPALAARVVQALAIHDATIRAGVLTGAAGAQGVAGSAAGDQDALPDLDACDSSVAPSP